MAGKVTGRAKEVVNSRSWKVVAVFCALLLASQVLPLTRLAYGPQDVVITGDQVTMYRSFPGDALGLPRPRISYLEKVMPLTPGHHGGHPCVEEGGPFRYGQAEPVGSWAIPWAAGCLNDPHGYAWEATWTWHLGVLTLGSTSISHRVFTTSEREP